MSLLTCVSGVKRRFVEFLPLGITALRPFLTRKIKVQFLEGQLGGFMKCDSCEMENDYLLICAGCGDKVCDVCRAVIDWQVVCESCDFSDGVVFRPTHKMTEADAETVRRVLDPNDPAGKPTLKAGRAKE